MLKRLSVLSRRRGLPTFQGNGHVNPSQDAFGGEDEKFGTREVKIDSIGPTCLARIDSLKLEELNGTSM
jgi:hypothetical protein